MTALGVPCNSPCFLVTARTEIKAVDYNNGTSYPIISNLTRPFAIDIHFSLGYIFWSDGIERNIKRANIDGTNITTVHNNTGNCGALAVEWISMQLYWTDQINNMISASHLEGNNRRILVSSNLDQPEGIALDPNQGLMFWTDWGHKIERATLSGTQRVVIVTSNLFWAFSLDLDRRNRLVFWVDWWWDRVESVDYHGNNRKLLFYQQLLVSLFPGVTFFSSYLFVPGWGARGHGIYKFSATDANGTVMSGVTIGTFIRGFVAYDSSRQLPVLGVPCKSPCLLVSTTTEIIALDYSNATIHPIISNLTRVVAIDIHFNLGYIFWSDLTEQNIKRANIDGTNIIILHNNTGSCLGLAVEWKTSQLYWTDRNGTISMSDLDGNNKRILLSSQGQLSVIVLDPERGLMFWTVSSLLSNPAIKKSTLNGTQLVTLVTSSLSANLKGIDLDRRNKLVFWVDAATDRVESVDYEGNNRRVLYESSNSSWSSSGVVFLSSYLFVTMWTTTYGISKLAASNGTSTAFVSLSGFGTPMGLVPYDLSRQLPVTVCPAFPTSWNGTSFGCSGNGMDYHYDTVCRFWCKSGYIGSGSQVRRCQHNGTWSGQDFTCQMIACPALPAPSNGTKFGCPGNTTVYNDTVCQFSCNNGYIGSGSQVRRCQHNGTWSGQDFNCQRILCEPLHHLPNLRMNTSCTRLPGDSCEFACERGYNLIGSANRRCNSDGTWTGTQPRCDAVTCPTLPPPTNGELLGCNTTEMLHDTVCRFSCKEGSEASGSTVRRCTENGTWSGNDLVCTGITNMTLSFTERQS
ncbi:low-density lipoprotein receptor-related protein 2-like isoform X2 [Oculina patagonica]